MGNGINSEEVIDLVYPIGSIYLTVSNENPTVLFGGSWQEWGKGKVPVGVDSTQTEFDTVEKTGGSKLLQSHSHTGTTNESGNHYHWTNNSANVYAGSRGTLESWGDGNTERSIATHLQQVVQELKKQVNLIMTIIINL